MTSFTEKWFIRKIKDRDPKSFEQLVRKYEKQIFNLLFRMTGVREEAEDLAQEVFITVYRKIGLFREESSIGTWIYTIALNQFRNRRKYLLKRRESSLRDFDEAEGGRSAQAASTERSTSLSRPDEIVEGLQMERLIQNAILDLDEEQRAIIVLRDVQNMSYQDICRITGLAEGTVKSRLHRARMALKERLSPHMR